MTNLAWQKARREESQQRYRESHAAHPEWTAVQHAEALGVHYSTIHTLRRVLGLRSTPRPRVTVERFRLSVAEHPDWCASEHARDIGVSRERVGQMRRELGLVLPCKRDRRVGSA